MKMAMMATDRHYFITGTKDFHGKSLGALSLTGKGIYRQPFLPMLQGVRHVPFGDFDYLKKTMESMDYIGELPAAVILEPIEGEIGVIIPPDDYFPKVRELCDEYDVLLIADEVQTGLGRTGKLFAMDHWGVAPDILCLAKAMGGGVMPLSATVSIKRCYEKYMYDNPWMHSTTTGGNPLACAAGIAAMNVMLEEDLAGQAAEKGDYFMKKLNELQKKYSKILTTIRGKGLLIVMEFCDDEKGYQVVSEMFSRGVLLSGTETNAHAIRIEPPLNISYENIDEGLKKLDESLSVVAARA
jgi:putrescine aminotransferase